MDGKIDYLLSSTFHDPEFKLKKLLENALPTIKDIFSHKIISCTPVTGERLTNFLSDEEFIIEIEQSKRQIDTYRLAIKKVLEFINHRNKQKIFCIDFDRLIHWVNAYPDELIDLLNENTDLEYLHIGRTKRAFDTHPFTQTKTEGIINEIGSKILGFPNTIDIISVCYIINKRLAENILRMNNKTATGFYSSWPIVYWNLADEKRYIEVEGLEWETPDRFRFEISKLGFEEWLNNFQSSQEWQKRVDFLRNGLNEMHELLKFDTLIKF